MSKSQIFRYYFKRHKISHTFIKYLIYILRNFNFIFKDIVFMLAKISKL